MMTDRWTFLLLFTGGVLIFALVGCLIGYREFSRRPRKK